MIETATLVKEAPVLVLALAQVAERLPQHLVPVVALAQEVVLAVELLQHPRPVLVLALAEERLPVVEQADPLAVEPPVVARLPK